jgi:hypothetical protein
LALLATILQGCTRDDICPEETPTTPLLMVEFKDISNRLESKAVSSFRVLVNDADTLEVYLGTSDTLVGIPLNSQAMISEFQFITNSNDTLISNTDIIKFTYTTQDIYINRACAFKSIYNELEVELETGLGINNWIRDFTVLKTTIEDDTEAHLTIFH